MSGRPCSIIARTFNWQKRYSHPSPSTSGILGGVVYFANNTIKAENVYLTYRQVREASKNSQ